MNDYDIYKMNLLAHAIIELNQQGYSDGVDVARKEFAKELEDLKDSGFIKG